MIQLEQARVYINFNKKYDWRCILPNDIATLLLFLFFFLLSESQSLFLLFPATADKYKNVVSFNNEEKSDAAKLASFEILTVLGKALSKPAQTYTIICFTETKWFLSLS